MSKEIKWNELTRQYYPKVGERFRTDPGSLVTASLMESALSQPKGHVTEYAREGQVEEVESDESGQRYLKMIDKMGGRLAHKWLGENFYEVSFMFDHGIVKIDYSDNYLKIHTISQDEKFVEKIQQSFEKEFLPPVQQGHIFAIVHHGANLSISSIGNVGIPLVQTNYTKQVLADYAFAIKEMKSVNPSGRIVILEGEPGTGKTHLIRGLLTDVPDGMFVLISPDMVPHLAGPELLPLLMQSKQSYALNGPIILVLEDADRCLVRREADNINSIQSLLNLGDGIVGSLLDLRIVATTNAKKLEVEPAILRPGRLSKRMEVGSLDLTTARGVFNRLLPEIREYPEKLQAAASSFKMTLAEAYSLARKHGWEPEQRGAKKKRNGYFSKSAYYDD